ncbi:hypothetical protein BH11MYX4_BH11MYX4_19440 [soil metagenome]
MHPAALAPHPAPISSPLPPAPPWGTASPFTLTPQRDDTALYKDARAGFSHLLPGRPVLGMATLRPGDPPADAAIHLQDAPITVRYRLEAPAFAASSAAELARGTAERFAAWRAQRAVTVDWANDSWILAWGVEAAAVAAYDVPGNPQAGTEPMREDVFVLVRQGSVLVVSWTYPRGFVDDPAYATFASVAEATMIWDPARWEQRGRVWPEGAFLGPGLFGAPSVRYNEIAKQLSTSPLLPDERSQVLAILSGVVSGAGAPWVPLAREMIDGNKRAILSVVRNVRLRAFVEEAFVEVHTAHDLRGLAIVLGRALDARRSSSSIPPAMPGSGMRPTPQAPQRLGY